MHKHGTIVRWDATRAFGFIRSADAGADVFVHLRDFEGSTAPREGLRVRFEEIHVGGKGPRAVAVTPLDQASASVAAARAARGSGTPRPASARPGAPRAPSAGAPRSRRPPGAATASPALALLLVVAWAGLLAWGIRKGMLPAAWTLGLALAVNLATVLAYAADKAAAEARRWRRTWPCWPPGWRAGGDRAATARAGCALPTAKRSHGLHGGGRSGGPMRVSAFFPAAVSTP